MKERVREKKVPNMLEAKITIRDEIEKKEAAATHTHAYIQSIYNNNPTE